VRAERSRRGRAAALCRGARPRWRRRCPRRSDVPTALATSKAQSFESKLDRRSFGRGRESSAHSAIVAPDYKSQSGRTPEPVHRPFLPRDVFGVDTGRGRKDHCKPASCSTKSIVSWCASPSASRHIASSDSQSSRASSTRPNFLSRLTRLYEATIVCAVQPLEKTFLHVNESEVTSRRGWPPCATPHPSCANAWHRGRQ